MEHSSARSKHANTLGITQRLPSQTLGRHYTIRIDKMYNMLYYANSRKRGKQCERSETMTNATLAAKTQALEIKTLVAVQSFNNGSAWSPIEFDERTNMQRKAWVNKISTEAVFIDETAINFRSTPCVKICFSFDTSKGIFAFYK